MIHKYKRKVILLLVGTCMHTYYACSRLPTLPYGRNICEKSPATSYLGAYVHSMWLVIEDSWHCMMMMDIASLFITDADSSNGNQSYHNPLYVKPSDQFWAHHHSHASFIFFVVIKMKYPRPASDNRPWCCRRLSYSHTPLFLPLSHFFLLLRLSTVAGECPG